MPRGSSRSRWATRAVAAAFLLVTLLFAGGALAAFGDEVVTAVDSALTESTEPTTLETTTDVSPTVAPDPPPPPPATTTEPAPDPAPEPAPEPSPSPPSAPPPPAAPSDPPTDRPGSRPTPNSRATEVESAGSFATVWLHRTLPDPTPAARRLSPAFARELARVASKRHVRWNLVLAVLRADGHGGRTPVSSARLKSLAARLAAAGARRDARAAVLALRHNGPYADRVLALAAYNRAVGLRALVTGLEAAKQRLEGAILADRRIDVYPGGRDDLASGRVNVRVAVVIRYLRVIYGQVTVSSLRTGHGFFARPWVPSAHVYGLAVDISALGGVAITGNQQIGGMTERAVTDLLLLPAEVQPEQIISLLGLSGPSFPLADHHDHIHVGF
jgi:hypothetical protein